MSRKKSTSQGKPERQPADRRSLEIVITAVETRVRSSGPITHASRLGDLLPERDELNNLRFEVQKRAASCGLQFDAAKLHIEPHHTIETVAANVSNLAGNPIVDD